MKDKIYRAFRYIFKGIPNIEIKKNIVVTDKNRSLVGKRILITGANRGIGFEIAKKCVEFGGEVHILGRSEDKLIEAKNRIGRNCQCYVSDLSDEKCIPQIIEYCNEKEINVLVNNAGISLHEKNCFEVTKDGFESQFKVNLEVPYFLSIEFANTLIQKSSTGSIINLVSERGLYCDDIPYGLTKAALISFTKGFSRRVIDKGIRVNAVAPGVTATDMTGYNENDNLYNEYISGHRTFLPTEVAETVAFLISDMSECISGEIIACDQGNYMRCDW